MKPFLLTLLLYSGVYANPFKEDWNTILYLLKTGLPLLLFVGAPLIITVVIVTVIESLKYTAKTTTEIFKEED